MSRILTGGVTITDKEINYVNDALINGWNLNHDSYIKRFEKGFADYVGSSYARTTSGGTQALLLALAAVGVGPGDEVILPDLTYFACSDVIVDLGAIPVFVDVERDTWCINPNAFRNAITSRTKAVMPVWMYGNAPPLGQILGIAQDYKIWVIEDACPAVGSKFARRHAGTWGDIGCFSFHGSKIMTTGFGGMLVTDNKRLYEKVLWLADHGEDKSRPYRFWQTRQGYSFDLANINCALGLAQLERIDELVEKKRLINSWYKKYLAQELHDSKITINYERSSTFSNMWMTSIVLNPYYIPSVGRNDMINLLKERDIDSRPFFFPISHFEMYKTAMTPNASFLGSNGINLPSGVQLTEIDVAVISTQIRDILNGKFKTSN